MFLQPPTQTLNSSHIYWLVTIRCWWLLRNTLVLPPDFCGFGLIYLITGRHLNNNGGKVFLNKIKFLHVFIMKPHLCPTMNVCSSHAPHYCSTSHNIPLKVTPSSRLSQSQTYSWCIGWVKWPNSTSEVHPPHHYHPGPHPTPLGVTQVHHKTLSCSSVKEEKSHINFKMHANTRGFVFHLRELGFIFGPFLLLGQSWEELYLAEKS